MTFIIQNSEKRILKKGKKKPRATYGSQTGKSLLIPKRGRKLTVVKKTDYIKEETKITNNGRRRRHKSS